MSKKKYSTFYLFKQLPSYWTGAATILNVWGAEYDLNTFKSSVEADNLAISNDWGMVGQDMRKAIRKFRKENQKTLNKGI